MTNLGIIKDKVNMNFNNIKSSTSETENRRWQNGGEGEGMVCLVVFRSTLHRLQSSERREPRSKKCIHSIVL